MGMNWEQYGKMLSSAPTDLYSSNTDPIMSPFKRHLGILKTGTPSAFPAVANGSSRPFEVSGIVKILTMACGRVHSHGGRIDQLTQFSSSPIHEQNNNIFESHSLKKQSDKHAFTNQFSLPLL